jgi:hypothetical protein
VLRSILNFCHRKTGGGSPAAAADQDQKTPRHLGPGMTGKCTHNPQPFSVWPRLGRVHAAPMHTLLGPHDHRGFAVTNHPHFGCGRGDETRIVETPPPQMRVNYLPRGQMGITMGILTTGMGASITPFRGFDNPNH